MGKKRVSMQFTVNSQSARQMFAEFLGTLFFQLFGVVIISTSSLWNSTFNAIGNGFLLAALVGMFGHISGAHLNPAVTLTHILLNRIPGRRGLGYIFAQIAGCLAGTGISYVLLSDTPDVAFEHLTIVADPLSALLATVLATWFFCSFFAVITSDDPNAPKAIVPVLAGLNLVAVMLSFGRYGALDVINPARALATAVLLMNFQYHYIAWGGSIIGAGLGAITAYVLTARKLQLKKSDDLKQDSPMSPNDRYTDSYIRSYAGRTAQSRRQGSPNSIDLDLDTDLDI